MTVVKTTVVENDGCEWFAILTYDLKKLVRRFHFDGSKNGGCVFFSENTKENCKSKMTVVKMTVQI